MFDTNVNLMPIVIMVLTLVGIPLATFFAKKAVEEVCALLTPYIGQKNALAVQARANELLDKGIGEAVLYYLPQLQAMGLTVNMGSLIAARVASYAINHAPDFAPQMHAFEGSIEEKVMARLVAHPAVQAAVSGVVPAPVQSLAAAA